MARARGPNRDKAFEIWKECKGSIDLVKIAEQLNVSPGTVRGWKSKDKWDTGINGALHSKERNVSKKAERSKAKNEQSKPLPIVKDERNKLTDKYKLFAAEYLRDFNATRSAMAVGYKKNIAHTEGWRLLQKQEVKAEIQRLKIARETELNLDVQRVIAEYMKIAFTDISDLLDFGHKEEPILNDSGEPILDPDTGKPMVYIRNYVSFKDSDKVDGSVIGEVKQGREGVSIKLHDKMKALKELEKYLGFMTEEDKLRIAKMRGEIAAIERKATEDEDKPIEIIIKRKGDA